MTGGGSVLLRRSLGVLSGSVPVIDRLLTPIVYLFYSVPRVAFLLVFLLLLGLGETSKVWLKLSLGTSIATLFFAENYVTQYGIGYYSMNIGLSLIMLVCMQELWR